MVEHTIIVAQFATEDGPCAEKVFRLRDDTVSADTKRPQRHAHISGSKRPFARVRLTLYRLDIGEDELEVSFDQWKMMEADIGVAWMRACFHKIDSLEVSWRRAIAMGKAATVQEAVANAAGGMPVLAF